MSDSSSESQAESSTSQQYTKGKKLMRKSKSLRIMPSDEEIKYRNKNFKNVDLLADYADKLKCTKCNNNFKGDIEEGRDIFSHPLLKVLMCKNCCDYYGNGDFSLDEDDEDKYCRWCGEGGTLFLCSKCICGFCPKCIKKHFGIAKQREIENDDDWTCFFCEPDLLFELRAICAQAMVESNKKKKKMRSKRESKLMNMSKKVSTGGKAKRGKKRRGSSASSAENETKEAPVEEVTLDDSSAGTDDQAKEEGPKKLLKRKRKSNIKTKAATTSDGTDSDKRETKRVKILEKRKSKTPAKENKKRPSEDSSSESDNEEISRSSSKPLPKNLSKSVDKLKDFFKVTEMAAELCVNVCKKKLAKMDQPDFITSSEKLIKESQKLTTVVTLLTTNLTAVSQSVTSLQNKLGLDAKTINISSLLSNYQEDAAQNILSLLLRGIEVNKQQQQQPQPQQQHAQQQAAPVQVQQHTQTSEAKTPTKEPIPSPKKTTPKRSPRKSATPKKDELMEIEKPAEPEKAPENLETEVELEKGEITKEVENGVEESENHVEDQEEAIDKNENEKFLNDKDDEILAALDDMFEDVPIDDGKKKEEKAVNGEKEHSPKKSEEISLEIFTQVEKSSELKSPAKDLERASTSNAIEGTVSDS